MSKTGNERVHELIALRIIRDGAKGDEAKWNEVQDECEKVRDAIAADLDRLGRIREAAELCCEHLRQHDNGQALIDAIFDGSDR